MAHIDYVAGCTDLFYLTEDEDSLSYQPTLALVYSCFFCIDKFIFAHCRLQPAYLLVILLLFFVYTPNQMQPVDPISMAELKRVLPEANGLLCASSIFHLTWSNRKFDKPIIVRMRLQLYIKSKDNS